MKGEALSKMSQMRQNFCLSDSPADSERLSSDYGATIKMDKT